MSKKFNKLTRANQRSLKANEKLQEHGIIFTRLPNGDGVYSVCIMVDGQRIHRIVGYESTGTTREQAWDFITKAKVDAKEKRLNLPKARKTQMLFREAANKYLARLSLENGKDLKMKEMRLKYHLVPFFKNTPLSGLSSFDIERYKKSRLAQRVMQANRMTTKGSVNRELAVLSHMLNKALEWGWIDKLPCRVKKFNEEANKTSYLTKEQIERLLDLAKRDPDPNIYLLLSLAIKTGMRKMELFRIRLEDVDLERNVIYIPKAKAGAREQPIPRDMKELIEEHIRGLVDTDWLFPSVQKRKDHVRDIRGLFARLLLEAGLDSKEITLHTLRHTAITHLVQAGVDLPTVQSISGHKTLAMVARYAHRNNSHIQAAFSRVL